MKTEVFHEAATIVLFCLCVLWSCHISVICATVQALLEVVSLIWQLFQSPGPNWQRSMPLFVATDGLKFLISRFAWFRVSIVSDDDT